MASTPETRLRLREEAIQDLPRVTDSECGFFASGEGRFRLFFSRDGLKSIILSLSRNQGEITPCLLDSAIKTQRTIISYEGKEFNSLKEEFPDKKPHEIHTGRSPQDRLADLRSHGWPVFEYPDGSLGMVYYGAGDVDSLFNVSVAVVFGVLAKQDRRQALSYLNEMWPSVERGLRYDIKLADIDGDGLIESNPQNPNALLNHTEKDSSDAYIDEDGNIPKPPYKYLTNNCDFAWSLRDSSRLARILGLSAFANELDDRRQLAQRKLNEVFWSDNLNFYVPLIAGDGRQVEILTDDVIEGLWAVVFPEEKQKL